ncbi:undecaprenyldiphospho-muramoylpentapeptide beta-N-acetylglucosaminyltransferase [Halochromatium glycolicum]|uniref:UDP-N-acetylglucosamine--N-acetylmuramyl-(pentapeptide) pyrophosphoryl-undecaprenol N-acetylglucosamine transferase n=1 Tax=Halochromatium glycolicum TaxID=85075 RepID=A0AAJ0U5Q8_9GAMM|nr:undecaprenyldiphospho-muramoylpentapeptide beta-N-acetylglucosaminyltransferase [Halochromatium glycolicum]MBK1705780.1 undecaprenyldiphospho-muramoylpentapeptide beta-N-acetylglucosaminyltransferase [Halochromatium glycolicum]
MAPTIAIMAGGTGGHVFPALAVAEALRMRGADVVWIGTRAGIEARLVPEHGFAIEWLSVAGLRGKGLRTLIMAPLRLAGALGEAAGILSRRNPAAVLGMGGFVSGPGGLMARLQRRPLVIQEQNSVPGLTNQWLARIADRVFQAFPNSFPAARRAITTGNPVRTEIAALPSPAERFANRRAPARLLVVGGSLGALALNETVAKAIALLPEPLRPQVRHQAGERTLEVAQAAYRAAGIEAEVTAFIADMADAYAWADLVICRSGALTVSELAAVGLPAIFIPYPHAVDDHQVGNARWLSDAGAAEVLLQREMTAERLEALLEPLLADPQRRLQMAEAARAKAMPDAAGQIADACLEVAR